MGRLIGFSNFANTVVSFFKNAATAPRTYTFPDQDVDFSQYLSDGTYTTWVPTWTGFSADPTGITAAYTLFGKMCHVYLTCTSAGTSNASSLTVTLPFAAGAAQTVIIEVEDNGTFQTGRGGLSVGSNSMNCLKASLGTFTGSGAKLARFSFCYQIQ